MSTHKIEPGTVIPFRSSMSVVLGDNQGRVFHRGQELVLTADIIENAKDRNGVSWLEFDPAEQVQRWGAQKFGFGAVPEGVEWWNGGDAASKDVARIQARDAAAEVSDPKDREAAYAEARRKFGTVASSWSM